MIGPVLALAVAIAAPPGDPPPDGRALFLKAWEPGVPSPHGGDGLGPRFNARSCVACHSLGGPGGAGPIETNVDVISLFPLLDLPDKAGREQVEAHERIKSRRGRLHPSLAEGTSIVVHQFGLDPDFAGWRWSALGLGSPEWRRAFVRMSDEGSPFIPPRSYQDGPLNVNHTQRSTPPLFGLGLLDRIPDAAIEAQVESGRYGLSKGRVARLRDGRIGRFGWKAQLPTLRDFTLTACAGEIGLSVPGFDPPPGPDATVIDPTGLDMDRAEADALVDFVAGLPRPSERLARSLSDRSDLAEGRRVFRMIGCADCHAPDLGGVRGSYTDLLLHDLGAELADGGSYYSSDSSSGDPTTRPASPSEWRTPPLWGLTASAPYLHDGRAATVAEAIALHGGTARVSALLYAGLDWRRKRWLHEFLGTLAPPEA